MTDRKPTADHKRDDQPIERIGVIGAGSWGTALAKLLSDKGYHVKLWAYERDLVETINEKHENVTYLPSFRLHDRLVATNSIAETVGDADLILSVSPSHVVRRVLAEAADHIPVGVPIVSASKGIENDSLCLVSEILEDVLPIRCHPYLAYLSGPSFAKEVSRQEPTLVVSAAYSHQLAKKVQEVFTTSFFRVYSSQDVIGVEMGGALKNVIAIAAGTASGMGLGFNAMAAVITRGLSEITRLAVRKGANPLTMQGLAGMGDLVLTCNGNLSRNRTVGFKLGQGMTIAEILDDMQMVAEGVKTSKSVHDLAASLGVEAPICNEVYACLYEDKPASEAIRDLLSRDLKAEMTLYR